MKLNTYFHSKPLAYGGKLIKYEKGFSYWLCKKRLLGL